MKGAILFQKALFVKSALVPQDFPPPFSLAGTRIPIISLMGRSNVGKSSLINHLFNTKQLAKVSTRPGKTQLLNFFNIDDQLLLVDVPGYGYAKAPKTDKALWAHSIEKLLDHVDPKSPILFLLDCRHPPSKDDLVKITWAHEAGRNFGLVLTKTDKLKPQEVEKNSKMIIDYVMEAAPRNRTAYIHFSIKDGAARKRLIELINHLIFGESI